MRSRARGDTRVATESWDKTARLWDTVTGANLCTYYAPDPVYSADFSPVDGAYLAIAVRTERHQVLIHSDTAR